MRVRDVAGLAADEVLVVDEELLLPPRDRGRRSSVHGGRTEAPAGGSYTPRCADVATAIDVGHDEVRGLVNLVLRAGVLHEMLLGERQLAVELEGLAAALFPRELREFLHVRVTRLERDVVHQAAALREEETEGLVQQEEGQPIAKGP